MTPEQEKQIKRQAESTTGSLADVRTMLARRFDTGIVLEERSKDFWHWAAKGAMAWGTINPEHTTATRPADNVLGFRCIHYNGFLVEVFEVDP